MSILMWGSSLSLRKPERVQPSGKRTSCSRKATRHEPLMVISPSSGSSWPATSLRNVDFPAPFLPMMPRCSPISRPKLTFEKRFSSLTDFATLNTESAFTPSVLTERTLCLQGAFRVSSTYAERCHFEATATESVRQHGPKTGSGDFHGQAYGHHQEIHRCQTP